MQGSAKRDAARGQDASGQAPSTKRPYEAPELIVYGSVGKLTQGTRTVASDGLQGGMMNPCL